MVPGENESAGKKKRTRCRKGNQALKRVLTQAAWAASHCKKGYLPRFFRRIQANADWGRAIGATAHKILIIAFQMLKTNTPYRDLGDDYFDRRHPARTTRKLVARLEALGHHVELTKKGPLPGAKCAGEEWGEPSLSFSGRIVVTWWDRAMANLRHAEVTLCTPFEDNCGSQLRRCCFSMRSAKRRRQRGISSGTTPYSVSNPGPNFLEGRLGGVWSQPSGSTMRMG
jgi:hypothetical protein